jgi:hypothetical protein
MLQHTSCVKYPRHVLLHHHFRRKAINTSQNDKLKMQLKNAIEKNKLLKGIEGSKNMRVCLTMPFGWCFFAF